MFIYTHMISQETYNSGLFIASLDHIPTGCGTWPAMWMYGEDARIIYYTHTSYVILNYTTPYYNIRQYNIICGFLGCGTWPAMWEGRS